MGKLPVTTSLGDLSQLGVSVKRLGVRGRPLSAEEIACNVCGMLHGHGRAREEGPNVVDFLIIERHGNVVKPEQGRSVTGLVVHIPLSIYHGSIQSIDGDKTGLHQVAGSIQPSSNCLPEKNSVYTVVFMTALSLAKSENNRAE